MASEITSCRTSQPGQSPNGGRRTSRALSGVSPVPPKINIAGGRCGEAAAGVAKRGGRSEAAAGVAMRRRAQRV
jgi:hypothetical protein